MYKKIIVASVRSMIKLASEFKKRVIGQKF
jgi:hypothetical protein